MRLPLLLILALALAGCARPLAQPALTPSPAPTSTPPPTATPVAPTFTPAPTPTLDPYERYTIEGMRSRTYGGGAVEIVETVGTNSAFTRYLIRYPSDGLTINGFMDVPSTASGNGPFPVIIALHGYIAPSVYNTLDYTTHYADVLASNGYFVLHPNLRNFPPSDNGEDLFRVGMATDVLNLIAIVKETGGQEGPLKSADPGRIGMWGHSMGGGVTTRVLTVSPDIKAAVLYGAVSGDELKNYEMVGVWSNGERGGEEREVPAEDLQRISPMYYFDYITAAVSINHGEADPIVPVQWSVDTCAQLKAFGKTVECRYYDGQSHSFSGQGEQQFIRNMLAFYEQYLRGQP